ncbi:TRAP transporter large permease [Paracoccus saliphilus]|uniref:TRAP transporter large permease protein n=1 Tax=Paracoccus saliphilus TaxID=405559 RepID=A0AA46A6C0_9RHOB|nr:TRAP transporter large permease [Paracoccus saliphilus]WCR05568.1 TRAP transporter large permease [Paracoccus saliphilus]SIS95707.1 TRAP transporter, DctM subunit [Paracoccus saliphilus]
MDPITIGMLGFLGMLLLIALHVPIGIAMALAGVVGFSFLTGNISAGIAMFGTETAGAIASPELIIIPMFLLMGSLAGISGLAGDLYRLANALIGHRKGGLAMATIAGCGGFGAACGSSIATTATMARIALPEMESRNYSRSLGTGCIAAGGTLGSLIPPSSIMLIYAFLTEQFVVDLFIAGILPGLLTIGIYGLAIYLLVRRKPSLAPAGERSSWAEAGRVALSTWGIILVILIMTVGLYGGIFTVTEAAAAGVLVTFLFAWARGKLNLADLKRVVAETAHSVGMLYVILIGAHIFSNFVTLTHMPSALVDAVISLGLAPLAVILLLAAMYIALGAIFDSIAAMVITLPFVFPLVTEGLGYDPIWWGIVMIVVIEIGMITPPIGINVFVMHGVRKDIPLGTIFHGIMPFLGADIIRLLLIILFPAIALWLPASM